MSGGSAWLFSTTVRNLHFPRLFWSSRALCFWSGLAQPPRDRFVQKKAGVGFARAFTWPSVSLGDRDLALQDSASGAWRFGRRHFALVGTLGAAALGFSESEAGQERADAWARWNAAQGDAYPLDDVARFLSDGERPACDKNAIVAYRGTTIRYAGTVFVHPAFAERLARFEAIVAEVAREVYGREPRRIHHYGAYNCRPVRTLRHLLSEHALGNAIDIVGFDFGAATKTTPLLVLLRQS